MTWAPSCTGRCCTVGREARLATSPLLLAMFGRGDRCAFDQVGDDVDGTVAVVVVSWRTFPGHSHLTPSTVTGLVIADDESSGAGECN